MSSGCRRRTNSSNELTVGARILISRCHGVRHNKRIVQILSMQVDRYLAEDGRSIGIAEISTPSLDYVADERIVVPNKIATQGIQTPSQS